MPRVPGGKTVPVFNGARGADDLNGTRGNDVLRGRGGADELDGRGGRDRLLGGRGDDDLNGGRGADRLNGGGGDDVLAGGGGRDQLTGGRGGDSFVFGGRWGADTITDFDASQGDRIDLTATSIDFTDLVITQTDDGARIQVGRNSILLRGIDATEVDASMFRFEGGKSGTDTTDSGSDDKVSTNTGPTQIGVQSNAAADLAGVAAMRADARFSGIDGSGYTVAVLDTGIDLNHAAFGADANGDGVSDRIVFAQDFSSDRDGSADDVQGHGSHVASIVGSETAAYRGVAPGADIAALQVLDNSGSGGMAGIESALRWVIDNAAAYNIVAVNMSLGGGDNVSATRTNGALGDEFAALNALGVITTVAAGNDFFTHQTAGVSSIAADPNALAVGAVWSGDFGRVDFGSGAKDFTTGADRVTSFSQRSASMGEIFAPGAMITGAAPGGGFASQGGTSQAAPVIAGMAALAQEIAQNTLGRRLTPAEFHSLLLSTADVITDGDDENDNVANINAQVPRANMLALAEAISALAVDAPAPPQPADDDHGDDIANASGLRNRRPATGEIETGSDLDVFGMRLREGQQVRVDLRGAETGHGTLTDPLLTLYGPDGAAITTDDDGGDGLNARIEFTASQAGRYYFAAQSYGDNTGTYTIQARRSTLARSPDDDHAAGVDTRSTVAPGEDATGRLEAAGDRDWHALQVVAGGEYLIDIVGAGGESALADPLLRLYSADRTLLATDDDGGEGLNSQLIHTATADGTIYVEAGAYADRFEGDYRVSATLLSAPGDGGGDVPDDGSTEATVAPGAAYEGELDPVGDRDWVAVRLTGGSVYTFDMVGAGDTPVSDTYLRLLDSSGAELASDDDGGEGLFSRIETFAPRSSGTYYLSAGSYADSGSGGYVLSMSEQGGDNGDLPAGRGTTSEIFAGGSVSSSLDFAGDRDWHGIELTAGQVYRIDLEGSGPNAVSDTYLRVYDGNANLVDEDDDGGEGLASSLIFTASSTGLHFISAAAYADQYEGGYTVSVEDLGLDDDFSGDTSTEGTLNADGAAMGELEIAGDRDWFEVSLVRGGTYQFDALGADTSDGTLSDPIMNLYGPNGELIATDDDGGQGLNSRITWFATQTGAHYVGVGGYGDGRVGTYEVVSQTLSGAGDDFGDDASTGGVLAIGEEIAGELESAGDADWFAVDLTRGAEYRFDLVGDTLSDTTLTLYDQDGGLLAFDDDGGDGLNSLIEHAAGYSGVHYLSARSYGDHGEGTYALAARQTRAGVEDDFGDTVGGAGAVAIGGAISGELEAEGDRDWIEVELFAGDTYRFDLRGADSGGGDLLDPYLRLRDALGHEIGYNDDGGVGYDSQLLFTAEESGAHYLDVQGYSSSYTGSWLLEAELA